MKTKPWNNDDELQEIKGIELHFTKQICILK